MAYALKLSIIAVIIVAVAVVTYVSLPKNSEETVKNISEPMGPPAYSSQGLRAGSNAIYVAEQLSGSTVAIGFVLLARPGFVVIYEDAGGMPGVFLGVGALLGAGETAQQVIIALSRETQDGDELIAMLHQDDGDGIFDIAKDVPVKDAQGNIIQMPFSVSADAEAGGEVSL